jgi:hypothetical protein
MFANDFSFVEDLVFDVVDFLDSVELESVTVRGHLDVGSCLFEKNDFVPPEGYVVTDGTVTALSSGGTPDPSW